MATTTTPDQDAENLTPALLGALGALTTDQAPESVTRYYRLEGGGLTAMTASPPSALVPPPDGTEITEAEYAAAQAEIDEAEAATLAEQQAEYLRTLERRYNELRALGLSHDLAAELSGYTGDPSGTE